MTPEAEMTVDDLAQEIRRVDGSNSLGAGALAEALMPFLASRLARQEDETRRTALEEADGWQPIETAPLDWSDVLLQVPDLTSDHRTVCEGWFDADRQEWRSAVFWQINPTHWRPLPPPPRTLSQKGDEADG